MQLVQGPSPCGSTNHYTRGENKMAGPKRIYPHLGQKELWRQQAIAQIKLDRAIAEAKAKKEE